MDTLELTCALWPWRRRRLGIMHAMNTSHHAGHDAYNGGAVARHQLHVDRSPHEQAYGSGQDGKNNGLKLSLRQFPEKLPALGQKGRPETEENDESG